MSGKNSRFGGSVDQDRGQPGLSEKSFQGLENGCLQKIFIEFFLGNSIGAVFHLHFIIVYCIVVK